MVFNAALSRGRVRDADAVLKPIYEEASEVMGRKFPYPEKLPPLSCRIIATLWDFQANQQRSSNYPFQPANRSPILSHVRKEGSMSVDDSIQVRRVVKHFDPDHKMTKKTRDKLLSTALLFPASFNIQKWHFVVVDDVEQRLRIREASWDHKQVTDASLLIILCTDLEAWKDESLHCWHPAQQSFEEFLVPSRGSIYSSLDPMQRDEVMRSCGIVAQTLMITAQTMGYDSCPMDGFDAEVVGDLINIPEDHAVCMFVAIGKGIGDVHPLQMELPIEEVVITDSF
jgi:nitroreductase